MRFPRDVDGKYNPKGEYREKTELLTVKGDKHGRFCFGVGIVDCGDGPEGKRIELFGYTTKNIIPIADTEKLINSTIAEVKQLPRDHKKWCITNRDDGVYNSNDPPTVVKGVSDVKAALLAVASIGSISKLVELSKDVIEKTAKVQGISTSGLSIMVAGAKSKAVAKRAPPIISTCWTMIIRLGKNMDRKRMSLWRRPG